MLLVELILFTKLVSLIKLLSSDFGLPFLACQILISDFIKNNAIFYLDIII